MAMKTVLLLALAVGQAAALLPAAAAKKTPAAQAAAKKPLAAQAKPKIHVDASEATSQLQELMAQASNSLAKAERHHERQVQKARKAVEATLDSEAKVLGAAVSRYNAELRRSADELQNLATESKAAVKEDEAHNSGTWGNDPGMEARARLGAQADMASREVRKAQRQHDRLVQSAQARAEEPLEDTTMKLSRKVGDLSEVVGSAKSLLETAAASQVDEDVAKPSGNATSNKTVNGTKHLEELAVSIKAAITKHRTDIEDAEKSLDKAVSNSSKTLETGIAKIEKGLDDQEQKEIKKVRDGAKMPPIGSKKPAKKLRTPTPAPSKKDAAAMKSLVELLKKAFKKDAKKGK